MRTRFSDKKTEIWRKAVKRRDKYTCRKCGSKNRRILQVHHIRKYHQYVELRDVVSNGITLCRACHLLCKGKEELFEVEFRTIIADKKISLSITKMLNQMKREEEDEEEV